MDKSQGDEREEREEEVRLDDQIDSVFVLCAVSAVYTSHGP